MEIKKLVGKRIHELRKARKITQEQMAEIMGIETVSLSNIERGRYYPTAENLSKIIAILDVEPQEIFTFKDLAPQKELLDEMWKRLQNDEKLTRLVYKFYKSVY